MGVDAEMFVRIRGKDNWIKPEEELKYAYELSSTVGADNFYIFKAGEYSSQHHCLEILTPLDSEWLEDNGYEEKLEWIDKVVYVQDGPAIVGEPDEQFIRIWLSSRLYHENYARGNWPIIRSVAEWLEYHIPQGEVWYGGDSSGFCAERLDDTRREELNEFFLRTGRKTYTRYDGGFLLGRKSEAPTCPCCEEKMMNTGGGGDRSFWFCDGCEKNAVTQGAGKITWGKRGEDIFKVSERAQNGNNQ